MRIRLLSVAAWLFTLLCPSHEVQVMQPENRTLNPDGTVSITCSHTDTDELFVIDARLNRLNNSDVTMVCQVNNSHMADCTYMKVTWNQYKFTLHNLKAEDICGLFQCEFSLSSFVTMKPIQTVKGKHSTKLLSEVQVMQPENRTLNPDGTVSITCSHTDTDELFVIDARLNRLNNSDVTMVCQVNNSHMADCTYTKVTWNQYKFTLHNLKAEDICGLFQCEFSLSSVVTMKHIQTVKGKHSTKLLPGLAGDVLVCPSPLLESPEAELIDQLKWIVIGVSVFLCFYSFTITFFYIRLRVFRSEELYDSLTYVPMQPNQTQPTTGRGNINSTYMDMRKVPVGVRGSRSINHNSQLIC
ncbi:uncharacterized protein [Oncorhynchus clarkii lewisi]|uniref:uncharacterized protein n=1 Tax=Oncorhynchus clarkii lewisi TaxID=490388 RepID=UPI0039B833B5